MSTATVEPESPSALADQLWDCEDVARIFGVNVACLKQWELRKQFPPSIRIGRRRLWMAQTIREFIERGGQVG